MFEEHIEELTFFSSFNAASGTSHDLWTFYCCRWHKFSIKALSCWHLLFLYSRQWPVSITRNAQCIRCVCTAAVNALHCYVTPALPIWFMFTVLCYVMYVVIKGDRSKTWQDVKWKKKFRELGQCLQCGWVPGDTQWVKLQYMARLWS